MSPTVIAELTHESNRVYQKSIGQEVDPHWDELPDGKKAAKVLGVGYILGHPNCSPSDLHQAWCDHYLGQGWSVGVTRDVEKKQHPNMVPFGSLPLHQRIKDHLFLNIVQICMACGKIPEQTVSTGDDTACQSTVPVLPS